MYRSNERVEKVMTERVSCILIERIGKRAYICVFTRQGLGRVQGVGRSGWSEIHNTPTTPFLHIRAIQAFTI